MCFRGVLHALLRWLTKLPLAQLPFPIEHEDDGVSKPPELLSSLRGPWNIAFRSAEPVQAFFFIVLMLFYQKERNV